MGVFNESWAKERIREQIIAKQKELNLSCWSWESYTNKFTMRHAIIGKACEINIEDEGELTAVISYKFFSPLKQPAHYNNQRRLYKDVKEDIMSCVAAAIDQWREENKKQVTEEIFNTQNTKIRDAISKKLDYFAAIRHVGAYNDGKSSVYSLYIASNQFLDHHVTAPDHSVYIGDIYFKYDPNAKVSCTSTYTLRFNPDFVYKDKEGCKIEAMSYESPTTARDIEDKAVQLADDVEDAVVKWMDNYCKYLTRMAEDTDKLYKEALGTLLNYKNEGDKKMVKHNMLDALNKQICNGGWYSHTYRYQYVETPYIRVTCGKEEYGNRVDIVVYGICKFTVYDGRYERLELIDYVNRYRTVYSPDIADNAYMYIKDKMVESNKKVANHTDVIMKVGSCHKLLGELHDELTRAKFGELYTVHGYSNDDNTKYMAIYDKTNKTKLCEIYGLYKPNKSSSTGAYESVLITDFVTKNGWEFFTAGAGVKSAADRVRKIACEFDAKEDDPSKEVLIVGRGCGKSLLVQRAIEALTTPFIIKDVIFQEPATVVFWKDGTKTVVKAQNEDFDPEKGLAMAISKKVYGNDRNYYKPFLKWIKKYNKQKFEKALEAAKKITPDEITSNGHRYVLADRVVEAKPKEDSDNEV